MATAKKLTRADVYKQIDAFRGVAGRDADGKPSVEQWVAAKRAETSPPARRALNGKAPNGKALNHGWNRIRVD